MIANHPLDATNLAWLARCERRLWLDQYGIATLPAEPTADARARLELRAAHLQRVLDATPDAVRLDSHDWQTRLAQTTLAMQLGRQAIIGAALEAPSAARVLRGAPDILLRARRDSTSQDWIYQPIAVVLHGRPARWDRLLLDAWRWLVGRAQGYEPPGELWLGATASGPARISRQTEPLHDLAGQLARVNDLNATDMPPIWFDSDHCPFCPWRSACDTTAHATNDIALLPGLSRRQGVALRQRGIQNMAQIAAVSSATLNALPDRLPYAGALLRLQAQALLSGRPLLVNTHRAPPRRASLFLDIEADPLSHTPWAFGLTGATGETLLVIIGAAGDNDTTRVGDMPVTLVRHVHEGWNVVARAARRAGGAMAHWGEAERLILMETAGQRIRQELDPLLLDAQREIGSRVALPVPRLSDQRGGGLKAIARWIGLHWPAGADHWTLAWDAYQQWSAQPSRRTALELLAPATSYLAADVAALAAVWRWFEEFLGQ